MYHNGKIITISSVKGGVGIIFSYEKESVDN